MDDFAAYVNRGGIVKLACLADQLLANVEAGFTHPIEVKAE